MANIANIYVNGHRAAALAHSRIESPPAHVLQHSAHSKKRHAQLGDVVRLLGGPGERRALAVVVA
eukprot:scaffold38532_cov29-Prasinocladus_malaysianus.AAC.1